MPIFDWFGRGQRPTPEERESATVRKIARALGDLPRERARFLAAFAYVLGRVAHADRQVSDEESAKMVTIVQEQGGLAEAQAVLVVEIAKAQNELFGGTENFIVTKELAESASPEQRRALLDCLFAVSAADEEISAIEEAQVRQIADELGFTHAEYVETRASWAEHRTVLKALRGRS